MHINGNFEEFPICGALFGLVTLITPGKKTYPMDKEPLWTHLESLVLDSGLDAQGLGD